MRLNFLLRVAATALVCVSGSLRASEIIAHLPERVITAWKDAGARAGWYGLGIDHRKDAAYFSTDPREFVTGNALPAFRLEWCSESSLAELPSPDQPFALDLSFGFISEKELTALARMPNLAALNLGQVELTLGCWSEIANLQGLRSLDLWGTRINDDGLEEVAKLKNLRSLRLAFASISDVGLRSLAKLEALADLDLTGTRFTEQGLATLAGMKNLRKLNLNFATISRGPAIPRTLRRTLIQSLGKLTALTSLRLCGTRFIGVVGNEDKSELVTDDDLKKLEEGLKDLTTLYLGDDLITDNAVRVLAGFKKLKTLDLSGTLITDSGLKQLAEMTDLETLLLFKSQISDVGLEHLTQLKNLSELQLGRHPERADAITDRCLKNLAKLKRLTVLNLYATEVTERGLRDLTGLRLTSLEIPFAAQSDIGLKYLLAVVQSPTQLSLEGWRITNEGIMELARVESITKLNLHSTKITDAGVKELARLENLTELDLSLTEVGDNGVKELARLPSLKSLNLYRSHVTDEGLKSLVGGPGLWSLQIGDTKTGDEGLKVLAGMKSLRELSVFGNPVTDEGVKRLAGLKLTMLDLRETRTSLASSVTLREVFPNCRIQR